MDALELERIAFGPIPSRRLGMSLGVNNIPAKHCSYNCSYCQVGVTSAPEIERRPFYGPELVLEAVERRLSAVESRGIRVDHVTFVPDGEPTLDADLGREVELVKGLGARVAVITNSSLLWDDAVRRDLSAADYVSVKVDAVSDGIWRRVDRPHRILSLRRILDGITAFSDGRGGTLVSETMMISGIDYEQEVGGIASFLATLRRLDVAYVAAPTRPPAEPWVEPPGPEAVNHAYQEFREALGGRVELLVAPESGEFGHTGDARSDILATASVHPLNEDAVAQILRADGAGWGTVEALLSSGALAEVQFRGRRFYVVRPQMRRSPM